MTIALVNHTKGASVAGATFTTTPSINTAGSDLIVIGVSQYQPGSPLGVPTDSVGNTYTPLTVYATAGSVWCRLYYTQGGSVGSATHTFTLTGSGFYGTLFALAFSGSSTAPSDGDNGTTTGGAAGSAQPGAIVPVSNGDVIVSVVGTGAGGAFAIDSGFTQADAGTAFSSGNNMGGAMAYLIQTTAASINPTWSWNTGTQYSMAIAGFKASAQLAQAWRRAPVNVFR